VSCGHPPAARPPPQSSPATEKSGQDQTLPIERTTVPPPSARRDLPRPVPHLHEHPLIAFKDGPAGRRARLVGGPDVWEVIGAVRSVRDAEPDLAGDEVLAVVEETSGTPLPFLRAALAYWGDYPEEVEAFLDRAQAEAAQARASWERQQELLGR
jgi:hypothetical protein